MSTVSPEELVESIFPLPPLTRGTGLQVVKMNTDYGHENVKRTIALIAVMHNVEHPVFYWIKSGNSLRGVLMAHPMEMNIFRLALRRQKISCEEHLSPDGQVGMNIWHPVDAELAEWGQLTTWNYES